MDRAMFVSHTFILYSWFTYLDDYFHLCSPYLFLYLLKTADTVLVQEPVDSRTQSPVDLGSRGTVTLQRTPTRQSEKEKKHCEGTYSRKPHAREAHMTFSFPFSYLIGAGAGGWWGGGRRPLRRGSSSSSSSIFIYTQNRIILHGLPRNRV